MNKEITTIATNAELEAFFAAAPSTGDGRLIFGLDATASREATWDMAAEIQAGMFKATGASLNIMLVYYRGDECKASPWIASSRRLADMMRKIKCLAGATQIGRVLDKARGEKISALVFVGDAVEEEPEELYKKARHLRAPVFMFQEGDDELAEEVFRKIAKITKGKYAKFEPGAAATLAKLLKAVAAFAVGDTKALDAPDIKLLTDRGTKK